MDFVVVLKKIKIKITWYLEISVAAIRFSFQLIFNSEKDSNRKRRGNMGNPAPLTPFGDYGSLLGGGGWKVRPFIPVRC
jgi:hypothetical protein